MSSRACRAKCERAKYPAQRFIVAALGRRALAGGLGIVDAEHPCFLDNMSLVLWVSQELVTHVGVLANDFHCASQSWGCGRL